MTPIFNSTKRIPGRIFSANLVILAQINHKLSSKQVEMPRILSQNGLKGQDQWSPFSIPAESIPRYMFAANFAIPAQIWDESLSGQGQVWVHYKYFKMQLLW